MRLQIFPPNSVISAVKKGSLSNIPQNMLKHHNAVSDDVSVSKLLNIRWGLRSPEAKINQIMIVNGLHGNTSFHNIREPCLGEAMMKNKQSFPSFYVVRDDLLHPLVNGNKARKLDALVPLLEDNAITDVVTCGGCQSAHVAAVAVSCAERGIRSHLLLRGEEPETLTGYNLVSKLFGNVIYVPRSVYAKREEMLARHAESVAGQDGSIIWLNHMTAPSSKTEAFEQPYHVKHPEKSRKVAIINEGAGDAVALLGCIRLIQHLSQNHLFGNKQSLKIIVDAGTGTTAVGLALGALCLGLPWEVTAVMLADKLEGYKNKEQKLISEFLSNSTPAAIGDDPCVGNAGIVQWVERNLPRKFGSILKGEVQECQKIANQTGILVDPIYTLAAWNVATQLSQNWEEDSKTVMLHTGGTLGMFGLAQRYKAYFQEGAAELY